MSRILKIFCKLLFSNGWSRRSLLGWLCVSWLEVKPGFLSQNEIEKNISSAIFSQQISGKNSESQ